MTKEDLRYDFHNEHGINWENTLDYVEWLENKILTIKNLNIHTVSKSVCDDNPYLLKGSIHLPSSR
jgi:hypothetical protein